VSAPVRLGINGFGRMGRLALRAGWGRSGLQFVHVNELKGDATTCAHLLEFDSVHGRWPQRIVAADGALSVADDVISFSRSPEPADVPWGELGVDVVLECSGKFRARRQGDPRGDRHPSRLDHVAA
jgi:glyceraldehyde 3-phosphate dehydrogenase